MNIYLFLTALSCSSQPSTSDDKSAVSEKSAIQQQGNKTTEMAIPQIRRENKEEKNRPRP